jgi:hypothetical protein
MERRTQGDRRSGQRTGRRTSDNRQPDPIADPSLETRVTALESVGDQTRHDLNIQFRRIAAMQAEIDRLKVGTERLAADIQALAGRQKDHANSN